jgi:muramoyltetrapeptide carboxypeptidase
MEPAIKLLQHWGLEVVIPQGLYAEDHQMAGTDSHRAAVLQRLIDDTDIRAILCARGGYGTVRILDCLNLTALEQHPKWIIGYSDVTALHSHIHNLLGMETLHATMPINIPPDAVAVPYPATDSLRQALFAGSCQYNLQCSTPLLRPGKAEGVVVGGNLSVLYSIMGSQSDIDTAGKILFIEDLDEYLYHIDRMMMCLKRSGKLCNLSGLIVGSMSDMHDNAIPFGKTAEEIIWDSVKEYDYPVCMGMPFGHIGMENRALILGRQTKLNIQPNGDVTIKQ